MHMVFALLCFVVVIDWLIFPYPSGLLHWHCGNLTIASVPAKQPWWIWINTSCEFIMNDCITITKQSTTKPCAYFLGYTVYMIFINVGNNLFTGAPYNGPSPIRRLLVHLGWGVLSRFPPFCGFPDFFLLSKHTVVIIEYHVYIWQVSPQISCDDTSHISMWFK